MSDMYKCVSGLPTFYSGNWAVIKVCLSHNFENLNVSDFDAAQWWCQKITEML